MNGEWIRKINDNQRAVIVFVHGVLSSGKTCWTNKNGATWPKLVEQDPALRTSSIYVFNYYTSVGGGRYSISDAADALWLDLQDAMIFDFGCPVIFVCHSMGGIVARRLIVKRHSSFPASATLGLFLVASPSIGSLWAKVLYPLIWLVHHSQATALRLSESNEWLRDLKNDFRFILEKRKPLIFGRELLEEKSVLFGWISWVPPVVRKIEGEVFFSDSLVVPGSDHFTIAKPLHGEAFQHKALRKFAETVVLGASRFVFTVPRDWRFDEAAQTIARVEKKRVRFVGFNERELSAKCPLDIEIEGDSLEGILSNLREAFGLANVGEYGIELQGLDFVLSRN